VATHENPRIKLRELVLKAGAGGSFFSPDVKWEQGESGKPTFNTEVKDNIHPNSPLSARSMGKNIKVWYRPATDDCLSVAWNDPAVPPDKVGKVAVWKTRPIVKEWPIG
jgi:hypothetical protein